MSVDVVTEDARWQDAGLDALAQTAAQACLAYLAISGAEVALLGCDDARITELNADFREKPTATNVLSWPAEDLAAEDAGDTPHAPTPDFDGSLELGDIAISYDTCAREAADAGKPMGDHVTHLIIHGVLHLLGYDHIRDQDATLMEAIEVQILGKMGIDDPYRA
ncbi:MAG: rRNA maturation RNase YbeY [Ascidiaceihabitans sp.]|nr:rRNA maturation RNase YbeY [Ascidiaceihabitans sp.]